MTRSLPLLLALTCLSGCAAGPQVSRVDHHSLTAIPRTTYAFGAEAGITVVPDQGVTRVQLASEAQGFRLEWEHGAGGVFGRTLQVEGPLLRLVEDGVAVGRATVLMLHGDGTTHVVSDEQDLELRYGANARAFIGLGLTSGTVVSVLPGSPASQAGLQPQDQLRALTHAGERADVPDRFALARLLPRLRPGQKVVLTVERDGKRVDLPLVLGERPLAVWNKSDG